MQTATAATLHAIPMFQKKKYIQRIGKTANRTEIPVRNLSHLHSMASDLAHIVRPTSYRTICILFLFFLFDFCAFL